MSAVWAFTRAALILVITEEYVSTPVERSQEFGDYQAQG